MVTRIRPDLYAGLQRLDAQVAEQMAVGRLIDRQFQELPSRIDAEIAAGNRQITNHQRQAVLSPLGSTQRQRENELLDAILRTNQQRNEQIARRNLDEYFARPFGQDALRQLENQRRNDLEYARQLNQQRQQSYERALQREGLSTLPPSTSPAPRPPQAPPRAAVPVSQPSTRPISPLTQAPQRPINLPRPPVTSPDNHPSNRTSNTSGVRAPVSARDIPRQARPSGWLGAQLPQPGQVPNRDIPRRAGNLSPPRSFPSPRAQLAAGGAVSALSFAQQVIQGEDPRRAALVAGGQGLGTAVGGILGAPFGGFGGLVGGAVGGLVGGAVGGALGNRFFPPAAELPQELQLGPLPFRGGGLPIAYRVTMSIKYKWQGTEVVEAPRGRNVNGPILATYFDHKPSSFSAGVYTSQGQFGIFSASRSGTSGGTIISIDVQPLTAVEQDVDPARSPIPVVAPQLLTRLHPENTPTETYYPSPGLADNGSPRGDGQQWIPAAVPAPRQNGRRDPRPSPLPTPEPVPSPGNRPTGGTSTGGQAGSISSNAPNGTDEATPSLNDEFGIEPQRFNFPIGAGAVPFAIMRPTRTPRLRNADRPGTQPQPVNAPPPPPANSPGSPCGGSPCGTAIRQDLQTQRSQLDRLNAGLNTADLAAGLAGLDDIRRKLEIIDNKLGSQIPNGGISGFVQQMQNYAQRAWKATQLDKVINALTLITTLHNAAMLSRELGETLGELTSQALSVIGIRDEENSPLNINEILSEGTETLIKNIVGEEVYNDVSTTWQKASRVISSATNIVWTLRSIQDSSMEVTEWVAENTGRIGNALKRWGVVGDRAYPWMTERIRAQDRWRRRFDRFFEGAENLEDAASSLYGVTSEVREIQEEISELGEARTRFSQSLTDFAEDETPPETPPDFVPIASAATDSAIASLAPTIKPPDAARSPTQPTPEEQEAIDNG